MNTDAEIDATQLRAGAGVPNGDLLVRFVDATYDGPDELAAVRDELAETMGAEAMIDTAAIVANFHMMTRIADGTGTPIDDGSEKMSHDLTAGLGIDDFVSRRLDPTAS